MQKMRRAMANQLSYDTASSEKFPPFDPKNVEGWEKMTNDEKEQAKLIYSEFEKLAHIMDDWAANFDKDMSKFNDQHPAASVQKPVTTPAAPAGNRKDTGARGPTGWLRNLRNLQVHDTTVVGKEPPEQWSKEYVGVGEPDYPEDPRTPTYMDNKTPPKPVQTVLPSARPVPVLPTIVDLTKDVKKPRTPETKELALTPKNVPQPPSFPAPNAPAQKPKVQAPPVPSAPTSPKYGNIVPQPEKKLAPGYAPAGQQPTEQIHHINHVTPTYSPYTFIPTTGRW
jgi:hypothetical protein